MVKGKAEEAVVSLDFETASFEVERKQGCSPKTGFVCEVHVDGEHKYHNPVSGVWYSEKLVGDN